MENEILPERRDPSSSGLRSARALEPGFTVHLDEARRLITAGVAEMTERDTVDPRVSDIVRRAGLSNKAFYRHFASKDELLLAILEDGLRRQREKLRRTMESADTALDRVRGWIREILSQALDPDVAAATRPLVVHQARIYEKLGAEFWKAVDHVKEPLRAAIAEAVLNGELERADPQADADAIYHLAVGWMQGRIVDRLEPDEAEAERIVAFAMRGLCRGEDG